MQITVLGAAGRTGTAVLDRALADGHQVLALVRDRARLPRTDPGLNVVVGDARQSDDLAKALHGSGAVISALGSTKGKDQLLARALRGLVAVAPAAGVRRVVVMSTFVASPNLKPGPMSKVLGSMMKSVLADKADGEAVLVASGLDWTVVYPTTLDKARAGLPVRVVGAGEVVSTTNAIAREDVAAFLVAEATSTAHVRQRLTITTT
ncbi:NAD(P)-dependent oxidoreductase [uncultured Friedmanniella sp.]|uniref:NAD(P)-dependent oxidoreductase n=1 Tax=uncultured Friedmanniella sp. TaxID=335381 RepID=UPI0035CC2F25